MTTASQWEETDIAIRPSWNLFYPPTWILSPNSSKLIVALGTFILLISVWAKDITRRCLTLQGKHMSSIALCLSSVQVLSLFPLVPGINSALMISKPSPRILQKGSNGKRPIFSMGSCSILIFAVQTRKIAVKQFSRRHKYGKGRPHYGHSSDKHEKNCLNPISVFIDTSFTNPWLNVPFSWAKISLTFENESMGKFYTRFADEILIPWAANENVQGLLPGGDIHEKNGYSIIFVREELFVSLSFLRSLLYFQMMYQMESWVKNDPACHSHCGKKWQNARGNFSACRCRLCAIFRIGSADWGSVV